eukprot:TRINITY_DN32175_c0_g1_i1.p1 TRINITY_DN32175_c0_g1~~TRINITY_DN32175_c0_g1_i1.p1  ORF type:complete len:238 (+),score=51.29 TRINITY_DN32175_c0_g1_i1:90-803(+)
MQILRHCWLLLAIVVAGYARPRPQNADLTKGDAGHLPEQVQPPNRLLRQHYKEMLQLETQTMPSATRAELMALKADPPSFREDSQLSFISAATGNELVKVKLEVPRTFSNFMRGLMFRHHMADDEAMIFRWDRDGPRSFWMENTYVPLDIIYVDSAREIVSIRPAEPLSVASVRSLRPASTAIEVVQGWCEKHNVHEGDHVQWDDPIGTSFVARDAQDFGADSAEVAEAVSDGTYRQ